MNEDAAIRIRRWRPDEFATGKGLHWIDEVGTADFMISIAGQLRADEIALISEYEHGLTSGGDVNRRAGSLAGDLVIVPEHFAIERIQTDEMPVVLPGEHAAIISRAFVLIL